MKKLALIVMILAVLALGVTPVVNAQPFEGVFAPAMHLPASVSLYVGLRIDEEAVSELDSLLNKVGNFAQEFSPGAVPTSTRELVSRLPGASPDDLNMVLAWAGDVIGVGFIGDPGNPETSILVVPLEDRTAAEAFVTSRAGDDYQSTGRQGRFTVYEGPDVLLFSNDLLYVLSDARPDEIAALTSGDFAALDSQTAFVDTVVPVAAMNYMMGVYLAPEILQIGANVGVVGGLGIQQGTTLTFEANIPVPSAYEAPPIDPEFARFIPAEANFFFHGSNLGGLIDASFDEYTRAQAMQMLSSTGIDFDTLIASTSGDFAVYSRMDLEAFWQPIITGLPEGMSMNYVAQSFNLGLVAETTDPEQAADFAAKLAAELRTLPIEEPGRRTETQETINGTDTAIFAITAADGSDITIRIGLASNEEIFAIGTYNGIESVLSGGRGFFSKIEAAEASTYFLPDASAVWFADGEILSGASTAALLVVLGPAIQNVFDNITDTLDGTVPPTADATPTQVPNLMGSLDYERLMERLSQFLRYMTASISPRDSSTLIRFTLTLGQ